MTHVVHPRAQVAPALDGVGFTLAVQGWAANPPTTIHAPASR
jgi:hypothetical protein